MNNISLIGMPTSGKSSIGRAIASQLKWQFYDIDTEIARLENTTIAKLYVERGEEYLKKLEADLISHYLIPEDEVVLSLSSSSFSNETMRLLKTLSLVVWLKPSIAILATRLKEKGGSRPFQFEHSIEQALQLMQEQRLELYQQADIIIDINNTYQSANIPADLIINQVKNFNSNLFSL